MDDTSITTGQQVASLQCRHCSPGGVRKLVRLIRVKRTVFFSRKLLHRLADRDNTSTTTMRQVALCIALGGVTARVLSSTVRYFYAYVRSKQNVQDKVGPLEDSAINIISQGFLMAEDLNGYFSSVFTKEDISSLPVADAKFQGAKSDYLGPLVVTPELVAKKIKAMKDNKSPGVDGIPPKLLMETVDQISIPLARVFNLSLKEGVVPFEWKEANIIPLFKKGSRNKSENYRPVSLTSVICKLLERLIKDHMVDFLVKHKLLN